MMQSTPGISDGRPESSDECGCTADAATQSAQIPPRFEDLEGSGVGAHDPAMAMEGHNYYLFCTGPGIAFRTSADGKRWSMPTRVFDRAVSWTGPTIPGSRDHYWAPDISYFNHRWHLYYAVSTFGHNRSAIGLATNTTLDPTKPGYRWEDEGPAVQSYSTDNFNAIDPSICLDEKGQPWMAFGSFWSGIKIVPIDPATGKPRDLELVPISIASRPRPGAIEAPCIIRHGGWFYLFASFDFCCRGVNSTYNIRVGRSKSISGPYADREGKPMLDDGGTSVLATHGRWHGPGGNSIMRDGRKDLLVYHSYDAEANGMPKLRIEPIRWDKEGWPSVASAGLPPTK